MNTNLLEKVRTRLEQATAERCLSKVSREARVPMTTINRIKNDHDHDPGYSKVQALVDYFWPPKKKRAAKGAQEVSQGGGETVE